MVLAIVGGTLVYHAMQIEAWYLLRYSIIILLHWWCFKVLTQKRLKIRVIPKVIGLGARTASFGITGHHTCVTRNENFTKQNNKDPN